VYLLKVGELADLVQKAAVSSIEPPPPPPPYINEAFVISGGSEVCGLTYSSAKRRSREDKGKSPMTDPRICQVVSFDHTDLEGVPEDHYQSLVIRIQIGTTLMRRVLIDGGSSANLIMRGAMEPLGLKVENLIQKTTTLVGFSGEAKQSLGEITLPTYVQGVTSYETFVVVDCATSYNVILGRPWLHNTGAVASTYHQCVKIPTKWGVTVIRGDHEAAQKCYMVNLKPSTLKLA